MCNFRSPRSSNRSQTFCRIFTLSVVSPAGGRITLNTDERTASDQDPRARRQACSRASAACRHPVRDRAADLCRLQPSPRREAGQAGRSLTRSAAGAPTGRAGRLGVSRSLVSHPAAPDRAAPRRNEPPGRTRQVRLRSRRARSCLDQTCLGDSPRATSRQAMFRGQSPSRVPTSHVPGTVPKPRPDKPCSGDSPQAVSAQDMSWGQSPGQVACGRGS
jgi:hypothetical protein